MFVVIQPRNETKHMMMVNHTSTYDKESVFQVLRWRRLTLIMRLVSMCPRYNIDFKR